MLSGIALLFIFLHEPPEHQTFSVGFWSLTGSRSLANSGPHPIPSAILAVIVIVWSITFWLVLAFAKVVVLAEPSFLVICFTSTFGFTKQSFSIARLVGLDRSMFLVFFYWLYWLYWLLDLQAAQDQIYLQINCILASDHLPGLRWII